LPIRILSLDIGMRRTGCAYCDTGNGISLPLDTLRHTSLDGFVEAVTALVVTRGIQQLVVGLPLLPSGQEGSQTAIVKEYVSAIASLKVPIDYLDERYTTPKGPTKDGDAMAALSILQTYIEKKGS
jgi:putative transcription antitermination factor YqgF